MITPGPQTSAPAADTGAGQAPRGYAKGRARRAEIVRTAASQFAEKGFGAATILDIAAACRISRAGLLHYFPDKEALLAAVLEERDAEDRARFQAYTRAPGGIGILRGMVDLADHNRFVPGLIELFARLSAEAATPDHPAHDYFVRRYDRIRHDTARTLRAAARAGYLRADVDPDDAAVRLTALSDGLESQWLLNKRIDMARHVRAAVVELLTESGREAFGDSGAVT